MRKVVNLVVLLIFAIHMTGCATILKPKETQMKITSEPEGADIYSIQKKRFRRDREIRLGRTPTTLTLKNRNTTEFVFKKDGYENSNYTAESVLDNDWMLASFACAVFPAFIDFVSRNARSFKEQEIKVTLDPVLPKQSDKGVKF